MTPCTNVGFERLDELRSVSLLRENLWHTGFRPVPVYTVAAGLRLKHSKPGKHPRGNAWELAARRDPPGAVTTSPHPDATNTGILGDGLRPVDLDVESPDVAARCVEAARKMLGDAPTRYRSNSARRLLLYRAAAGEPQKRSIIGTLGQIEVLGRGQQFVAFGDHVSGAWLQWEGDAPGDVKRDDIPAVTEDQIIGFLDAVSALIGYQPKEPARALLRIPSLRSTFRTARGSTPPQIIEARIRGLLRFLYDASVGERNGCLFWVACRVTDMVRDDELDATAGNDALEELRKIAIAVGLSDREIFHTIRSAAFGRRA